MAKDPAFLFYYQDFLVGTDHFTNEEAGAYIRCLCHQAHKGSISKNHMLKICLRQDVQKTVSEKFISDGNGNLYVAEINNHRIRKIVINSGEVTTFAGSGVPGFNNGAGITAGFDSPMGLAISNQNYLFVVDYGNNRIRKIDIGTAAVSNFVGAVQGYLDGSGVAARFFEPVGICFDPNGLLYIADRGNHKIRKVTAILKAGEFALPLSVKIYPNPAVDAVTIETNSNDGNAQLIITDCFGKEVYKQQTTLLSTTVNTSGLSKGIYFVSLHEGTKSVTQKLIIQ
jgi:hypothetical protein